MPEFIFLQIAFLISFLAMWFFAGINFIKDKNTNNKIKNTGEQIIFISIFSNLFISLLMRGIRLERFPVSNLYETLILLSLTLAGAYLFIIYKYKWNFLNWWVNIIILSILIYTLLLPNSQKEGLPLIPALQSYWRIIHVPPLLISYSFFCLSALVSLFYLFEDFTKKNKDNLNFYSEIIYHCISFGFPLLTFGIVTGALWANHAWGSLWQWDPKENLVLITWFVYAIYLHLKISGKANGKTLALIAFLGLLTAYMTYLGINQFNLGGLHTYNKVQ